MCQAGWRTRCYQSQVKQRCQVTSRLGGAVSPGKGELPGQFLGEERLNWEGFLEGVVSRLSSEG